MSTASATTAPAPGLFDLQVNGFAGVDFQQPGLTLGQMESAARALLAHRTSRILLTLITQPIEALCAQLEALERLRDASPMLASTIAGYHIEGPYLLPQPGFHGAHNPAWMKAPDCAEFDRLWTASRGRIRLITLAPEWPGSPDFIRHAVAHGVRLSIGHSDADDRSIDAAIAAGLTLCTHLGNGVPSVLPRHDNVMQRLLSRDELTACFIVDGLHLPPRVLKNFVRAKPEGKVLFTTDCMAAAGAAPGRYTLGALAIEVGADRVVREPGKPNFAGSSLCMDEAAENVKNFLGWSHEKAEAACGARVAEALGL